MKTSINKAKSSRRHTGSGKRPTRTVVATATSINATDDRLRESLAREILAVCVGTLKNHGFTAHELITLAQEAIEGDDDIPTTTKLFQDVSDLGRLVNEWAENAAYVDAFGRPKVLPILGGGPSFSSLARTYFNDRPLQEILQMGQRARVLERIGSTSVAHLGACVLLTGNPILLLGHAARSIRWFLGTAYYNAHSQEGNAYTWTERQAFTELPEDDFPEFLKFMREPIVNLTEMSNRWLMARAARRRSGAVGKKITMGMQAYLFRDP